MHMKLLYKINDFTVLDDFTTEEFVEWNSIKRRCWQKIAVKDQ